MFGISRSFVAPVATRTLQSNVATQMRQMATKTAHKAEQSTSGGASEFACGAMFFGTTFGFGYFGVKEMQELNQLRRENPEAYKESVNRRVGHVADVVAAGGLG